MTYATLMVHLELGIPNAGRLRVAGDLARRFDAAAVIGIAGCQPMQILYSDAGYVDGGLIEADRLDKLSEMREAEAEFRSALQGRVGTLEWRAKMLFEPLAIHVAREARGADLVITGVTSSSWLDASRSMDAGDLIMQAGRPVLIVPADVETLALDSVVIGWKETREARRAVADAVPLLKKALRVLVVEVVPEGGLDEARARLADILGWLSRHGIKAETSASASLGDDAARLRAIARDHGADVVVAGAYGHSRLREWALGGVTRDLLLGADRCAFVSH